MSTENVAGEIDKGRPLMPEPGLDWARRQFEMPAFRAEEITALVQFAASALLAIAKASVKGSSLGVTLLFIGANAAVGHAVSVKGAALFDMAAADMLDAIGDVEMSAAVRALDDARNEGAPRGRTAHRLAAATILRQAFQKFVKAAADRQATWMNQTFGYRDSEVRAEYAKAYVASSTLALIFRTEKINLAAESWMRAAQHYFEEFEKMMYAEFQDIANGYEAALQFRQASKMTPGKFLADVAAVAAAYALLRRPIPLPNMTQASLAKSQLQSAEEAVRQMQNMANAREHFERFTVLMRQQSNIASRMWRSLWPGLRVRRSGHELEEMR